MPYPKSLLRCFLLMSLLLSAACGTGGEHDDAPEPNSSIDTGTGADDASSSSDAAPTRDVSGLHDDARADASSDRNDGSTEDVDIGPAEVCDNGADDDGDGAVDCLDDACIDADRCVFVDLESADHHSCGLLRSGEIVCWGSNAYGRLGNGRDSSQSYPPGFVEGIDGAVSIATGRNHTCAALQDGSVRCWGSNSRGQLGDDSLIDAPAPVTVVGLDGVSDVVAGYRHTCALRTGGEVWCWGDNREGQAGAATTADPDPEPKPVRVGLTRFRTLANVEQLGAGYGHNCALTPDLDGSRVYCWGSNYYGQLGADSQVDDMFAGMEVTRRTGDLHDAIEIGVGKNTSCAIREGGEMVCWGRNREGQLGVGVSEESSDDAVKFEGFGDAVDVWMGDRYGCGERMSGQTVCWGTSSGAAFGPDIESGTERYERPIVLGDVASPRTMALSSRRSCWIDDRGALFCRGSARNHRLGVATALQSVADPQRIVPTFEPL